MMAVDYFIDKKWDIKSLFNKWPYFLISLVWGAYGIIVLGKQGSLETNENTFELWQRLFIGSYSYLIYLIKVIVPFQMSPLYPYPSSLPASFYPTLLIAPIMIYIFWYGYKKQWFHLVFALTFFTVNIIFLLQILAAGQGFIADRFTYIAYFGFFFLGGYILDKFTAIPQWKLVTTSLAVLMVLCYTFVTINQVDIWKNSATLWTHVLKYYDKTTLPFGNRANYYRSKKMYKEALEDYDRAIKLKEDPQTFNSRARLYFDTANDTLTLNLALKDYNKAIELKKDDGEFWINRGATYARLGNLDKAIENINTGLKLKPNHATGYKNRSVLNSVLASRFPLGSQESKQYIQKAINDIDEYQKFNPYEADIWYEKARLKRNIGQLPSALEDVNKAIQMDGSKGLYYYERAIINNVSNNKVQARQDLNAATNLGFKEIDAATKAAILN